MQKYHDHLHGQAQQPTPSTVASQQQRQSWHDLAGQYGLEDMLEVSGTSSQLGQGVEEQYELYETGPISPCGTDVIGFWAGRTMSHYFPICVTDFFADKQRNLSKYMQWHWIICPFKLSRTGFDQLSNNHKLELEEPLFQQTSLQLAKLQQHYMRVVGD